MRFCGVFAEFLSFCEAVGFCLKRDGVGVWEPVGVVSVAG